MAAVLGVALHLFDAAGILFHGDLLYCTLKTKERFDVQTGRLFKTRPFFIFWVNLTLDNRYANFVKLQINTVMKSFTQENAMVTNKLWPVQTGSI